jgi:hypothetical protein
MKRPVLQIKYSKLRKQEGQCEFSTKVSISQSLQILIHAYSLFSYDFGQEMKPLLLVSGLLQLNTTVSRHHTSQIVLSPA